MAPLTRKRKAVDDAAQIQQKKPTSKGKAIEGFRNNGSYSNYLHTILLILLCRRYAYEARPRECYAGKSKPTDAWKRQRYPEYKPAQER